MLLLLMMMMTMATMLLAAASAKSKPSCGAHYQARRPAFALQASPYHLSIRTYGPINRKMAIVNTQN